MKPFQIFAAVLLIGMVCPLTSRAHGDLELRILEITRKIQSASSATNRARLYFERGELQREHAAWDAAEADFDQAASLDPSLAAVNFGRGRLLFDSGKFQAAREMFDKGLARDPRDGEALIGRARVFLRLSDTNAAVRDFRQGLNLLPEPNPEYYLELSQALAGAGRVDEAIASIDSATRKIGFTTKLEAYALDLEIAQKKNQAALSRLDTIIQHAMRKESWLARRGEILLLEGKNGEARKAFEASLAAIKTLPPRLQRSPGMLSLHEEVNTMLSRITAAKETGNSSNN